jgi:hypothetical protein
MNKGNLKDILHKLYNELDNGNEEDSNQANIMLDRLLGEYFNVSPLSIFLYDIRKKDCVANIYRLLKGENISDFEVAKALSSLVTHLIIATEKDVRRFHDLRISEVIVLLNDYIKGEIDNQDIIDFFIDIL